jgi:hypothetical protein
LEQLPLATGFPVGYNEKKRFLTPAETLFAGMKTLFFFMNVFHKYRR